MVEASRSRQASGPAWGLRDRALSDLQVLAGSVPGPGSDDAWGGSTGRGVRVCIVDSGVERDHPLVGPVDGSFAVRITDGGPRVEPTEDGDACGHGTACAGIVRSVAPDCELYSVGVLGRGFTGTGEMLLAGLRWAVEQQFDVINLSLSTTRRHFAQELHDLADAAAFHRTLIVASAHNSPVESYPWRFSSVVSVGSHHLDDDLLLCNPQPPVDFFARGQNLTVAWIGGGSRRTTGNSFATPRVAGLAARVLAKHRRLTTYQVKSALYQSCANVRLES